MVRLILFSRFWKGQKYEKELFIIHYICFLLLQLLVKKTFDHFLVFLVTVFISLQINAQSSSVTTLQNKIDIEPPEFYSLKITGGMEQNSITYMAQDSIGQMWFATKDGVVRYDTKKFHIYKNDFKNSRSIGGNFVERIFVGKDGSVWVGTEPAVLSKYNPVTDDFETIPGVSGGRIKGIQQDKEGIYWITSNKTLYRYDDTTKDLKSYTYKDAKVGLDRLLITSRNQIFITTNEHYILEFDTKTTTFNKINIINKSEKIHTSNTIPYSAFYIEEDLQGYIWITTPYGYLMRYHPKNKEINKYVFQKSLMGKDFLDYDKLTIMFITKDDENNLWFGTWFNGLYKIAANRSEIQHFMPHHDKLNTLTNNIIHSGFQDKAGYMWFGTEFSGLNILKKNKKFKIISYDENHPNTSLPNTAYTSTAIDNSNRVWVGTDGKGLYFFDKKEPNISKSANQIFGFKNDTWIFSLLYDSKGFLWVGTNIGLYKYHTKTKELKKFSYDKENYNSLGCNQVICLEEDENQNIWIGTMRGLSKLDTKNNKFYRFVHDEKNPNSLSNNVVRSLYCDANNTMWVGAFVGLNKFNPTTGDFRVFKHSYENPNSIGANRINSISEADGCLWVGTQGAGLNKMDFDTEKFQSYYTKTGFPADNIKGIIQDSHSNLWLSTTNEIIKYNPKTEQINKYGKSDGIENKEYIKNIGLQDIQFYSDFANKDQQGYLYFGGVAGMTFFHPDSLPQNTYKPPVTINQFLVNGKPYTITKNINLKANQNKIELSITALNYIQSDKNQYAFYLENYDSIWQQTGAINKISYFNLPQGDFKLHYKASNNDAIWNEDITPISFTILPVFYKSTLFYFLLLTLVLLLVSWFFIQKLYLKRKIERQRKTFRYSTSNLSDKEANEIDKLLIEKLNTTDLYLEADLTLHKLAEIIDVKPNNLSQVINQVHGRNFNEFINLYRLKEAKRLLTETYLKIEAVAYDSGFNSLSTFNTFFKKEVGITPSKYRKENKKQPK